MAFLRLSISHLHKDKDNESISIDNPLDSNRSYLRTSLKDFIDRTIFYIMKEGKKTRLNSLKLAICIQKTNQIKARKKTWYYY